MKALRHAVTAFLISAPLTLQAAETPPAGGTAALRAHAHKIDQQVAAFYRNKKLPVPEVTDDFTYLRRVFLVTVGRIPTPEETIAFVEMDDAAKRENLVTYLLASPGYSSHLSNWLFDLLRVTDQSAGNGATNEPYRHWIRRAAANNLPWDRITQALVASSGDGWAEETAAVGYYTRDRGMPLDNLSNTMRIFLGARMECAQCHDDPFGTTERHDFYRLAAFTHGQEPLRRHLMEPLWSELSDEKKSQSEEYRIARILWERIYGMSLGSGGSGRIPLPDDYQYRDAKPGDIVGARTPFGKVVRMSDQRDDNDGREKLAHWIVGRTEGRFAGVAANRMWKRVMGKGLYEPVDEYVESDKTPHPALTELLGQLMVELKYDLRAFQNVLLLTRTFQFATNPKASMVETGDDFHGRKIERLSAEQIWDSLITLAAGSPDQAPPRALDERVMLDGRPVLVGRKTMPQLSREVLALDSEKQVRAYFKKLTGEIRGGTRASGDSAMMQGSGGGSYGRDAIVRASELPSPAPRDHFLYLFGASDREVVDAASREPNVGQVLSLMNGFVQRQLVNKSDAHLYGYIRAAGDDTERIRRIYLSVLSRPPTPDELEWMKIEVKERGEAGFRNIVSSLVMSSEFLYLQ